MSESQKSERDLRGREARRRANMAAIWEAKPESWEEEMTTESETETELELIFGVEAETKSDGGQKP